MEKKNIKIYQTDNRDYRFMNYEFAIKNGFDMKDYEVVAEFFREEYENDYLLLERIFRLGNEGIIQQLCNQEFMRSISVSDVIEIDGKKYFVDSFGFKEVE